MLNPTLIPKFQSLKALENPFYHFSFYAYLPKLFQRCFGIYYAQVDFLNAEYLMNLSWILKFPLWGTIGSSLDLKLNRNYHPICVYSFRFTLILDTVPSFFFLQLKFLLSTITSQYVKFLVIKFWCLNHFLGSWIK